jgi:hypothetical protein
MLAYFKTRSLNVVEYTVKITKNLLQDSKKNYILIKNPEHCTIVLINVYALYGR